MTRKIVCFHLFNDYSGSPKVLNLVLGGLVQKGYDIDVVTSKGGVLKNEKCHFHYYSYSFSRNPLATMCRFLWAQLYTFLFAFRYIFKKDVLFYVNTLLPVGPAIAGRLMGKRVLYHYHENAFAKGFVYKQLCRIMQFLATDIICVSKYQQDYLVKKEKTHVVPNVLPHSLTVKLHPDAEAAFKRQTVMLVASLKGYKGVKEFIELAKRLPQYKFVLVLNELQETIDEVLAEYLNKYENLTIYPRQTDIAYFYNEVASVVLNLSNKFEFIETFGLTALEAMAAGLPVIVPTVGGISEMVENGKNGYLTDVQDLDEIEKQIVGLLSDKNMFSVMAENALQKAVGYNEQDFVESITNIIK